MRRPCQHCGELVTVFGVLEKKTRRACSWACEVELRRRPEERAYRSRKCKEAFAKNPGSRSGEKNANWQGGRGQRRVCILCCKEFWRPGQDRYKFCCREHYKVWVHTWGRLQKAGMYEGEKMGPTSRKPKEPKPEPIQFMNSDEAVKDFFRRRKVD